MKQQQRSIIPTEARDAIPQGSTARRLMRASLVGLGITCLLTLIEALILWLLGSGTVLVLVIHAPLLLLFPLLELFLLTVSVFILDARFSLILYLHAVHRAQEQYHTLYTPLTALANLRKAAAPYQEYATSPTVSIQDQQTSILDMVQQQESHQLILGVPGAGKTMALRVYQYIASQRPWALVFSRSKIPVYVPMKNYSLFLKTQNFAAEENIVDTEQATLFEYLYVSDLPGIRHLRPVLQQLAQQGRLLLLCDGLNEIDSNYLTRVSDELVYLMRSTSNRLVMTCREVDYREQPEFVQLVEEGQAARAVIYPLQPEQVSEFVERYVEKQDKHWKHTAGQIMQVIDRSRLRYHCTNPMMLFTLMGIIDRIGIERGKQIDTRGRLLREYVTQLIAYEQRQPKWNKGAPAEPEVLRFLSAIACAARWANDRNAIQLRVSAAVALPGETSRARVSFDELADELQFWLDEHPAQGPFAGEDDASSEIYDDRPRLLQFALSAALIEVSPSGVLSFRHELIAEYFVAEYFFVAANKKQTATLAIREELLENVGRWSEPVAIWAGLLDKPLLLAERFGALGLSSPAYILQALALGLVCVGVLWTPPQAEIQRTVLLPPSLEESLSMAVRNKAAREELASIFTRCAEEGGQEVYRSLLPLIMVEGVDDLLTLLDQTIVPELLFTHLQDAVNDIAYDAQVKRLTRVLGRFGSVVVDRAAQLSQPAAERSLRLRAAAINILGSTNDPRAVEPLIVRLRDTERFILERATNSLIRLGPGISLTRVLQELENRTPGPLTSRVHAAALAILGRFMDEPDTKRQLSLMQYQRILESVVPVLTSNYQQEPEVQLQAREILVRQGRNTDGPAGRDKRWEKVLEALFRYLTAQNDIAAHNVEQALQEIGTPATLPLLGMLKHPTETVRVRVIVILQTVRDLRALPELLRLLGDPATSVQQQAVQALQIYAPESIDGLITLVLSSTKDIIAERAADLLVSIGVQTVLPMLAVLPTIVAGRTRLLVQALESIHDPRAVPALITLLHEGQSDALLAVTTIRALGQFPEPRVVAPLLATLAAPSPQLYEEGITALSMLGEIALDDLVAALAVEPQTLQTQRVCRAILGMLPFPGEQLIHALENGTPAQATQLMGIFKAQGPDAAVVLVKYLLHPDEHVRDAIHETLNEMPGPIVVPALLEVLDQPALRKIASTFLLKYPDAAISPLVDLLGEHDRAATAAAILPQFGPLILRPLLAGLDDQRSMARELAQRIIVSLVRQSSDEQHMLYELVRLFSPPPPSRARDALIAVLTNELSDISLPALLEGLEDAYLIDDVAESLLRLSHRASMQNVVLDALLQALYQDDRRRGAEAALIKLGASAVAGVGELITDPNQFVARSAKNILREIGVAALPLIWTAQSDSSNAARREAALDIFRSMRTEDIKDELVALLVSNKRAEISMAVALLLERIHEEATRDYGEHIMVPELITYIQTHTVEATNLRILSLLLLLGEEAITDHLIQALEEHPKYRRQLTYAFLLLGKKTHELLLEVFEDAETKTELRTDIAAVLSMVSPSDALTDYARNINKYGLSPSRTSVLFPDQLSISLRALGGLLASGQWSARKLQELRNSSQENEPAHELFSILLGWRYEPQISKLENEMATQQETFKKELLALTGRIVTEQKRAQGLETDLEKIRDEHGLRGDELKQTLQERDTLKVGIEQANKEKALLRANIDQITKEKTALRASVDQLAKEKAAITAQYERLRLEQQAMQRQIQQIQQIKIQNQPTNNTQIR